MPRKMTEEEWDMLCEPFITVPIVQDGTDSVKEMRVRRSHVRPTVRTFENKACYQTLSAQEIGYILEDAVHLILYKLNCIDEMPPTDLRPIPPFVVSPHSYKFIRHPEKGTKEVDFQSSSIVIECKNWADDYEKTESYINEGIFPRFEKYESPEYRKILLITSKLSNKLEDKLRNKDIEIFYLGQQIGQQIYYENFLEELDELLPIITSIIGIDITPPDVSCIWV